MGTISDYASLTTAIGVFAHRTDLAAASYTDYLIQAAQEQIERDIPDLNFGNYIRFQENEFTPVAISGGVVAVPSDWLGAKVLTIADGASNTFPLIFKSVAWIYDRYSLRQPLGLPAYIARDTSTGTAQFIFGPYPDSAYTVAGTYYQKAPLLSASTTTNWMTTNAPYLLLAACMVALAEFIPDDADTLLKRWLPVYQQRLQSLVDADKAERWAAATMQVEIG